MLLKKPAYPIRKHKVYCVLDLPTGSIMSTERFRKLQEHLAHEHKHSPIVNWFKEVVYGGIDGIVTTFAVVAGFSGAALSQETTVQLSFALVLLFGLANLFADAASMGLGNFLSVRAEQDLYKTLKSKELKEIRENKEMEIEESITILMQKNFSEDDARQITSLYQKNEDYWADFMMTHELDMPNPMGESPVVSGLMTFTSFVIFGAIPLLPFIFKLNSNVMTVFEYSVISTLAALSILGLLKWKIIGGNLFKSLFDVIVIGGTAALIAFFVGSLFRL